ncbi:MAG: CDP-alcohol phosphatidyltransferase family protein, partial [candidate division Zixibacteria bacterium]
VVRKNIPNALSILRIIMIIPFIYAFVYEDYLGVVLILATILATDYFDGYLARKWDASSDLGRVLDPLADKITVASIGILMVFLRGFPLWLALGLVVRDLLILIAAFQMMRKELPIPVSNNLGRFTVGVFAATMIVYLFRLNIMKTPAVLLSTIMIVWSMISYGRVYFREISSISKSQIN